MVCWIWSPSKKIQNTKEEREKVRNNSLLILQQGRKEKEKKK